MPTINATVYTDEAYVLVEADWSGALLRDSFERTSANSWLTPDLGAPYVSITGATANMTINGHQGLTTHSALATTIIPGSPIAQPNIGITGTFANTVVPTGTNFEVRIFLRFQDFNNFTDVRFFLNTTGTVTSNIRNVFGGVSTTGSTVTIPGVSASGVYGFRFEANGPNLAARLWAAGTPEPLVWHATLGGATMLTAGSMGTGSFIAGGVTNPLPISFLWDDLLVYDLSASTADCAQVTRRNTVTGEVVYLRPYIFYDTNGALMLECGQGLWWDTEPPLNVPLEYCTFQCDVAVTKSLNPTFDSNTVGWQGLNGTVSQDCTVAKVGTCSGRLTPNGTNTNPAMFQDGTLLSAGLPATISTWAMSPQGWNSVLLRLNVTYSDLTTETIETPLVTLDDNEWRFLSATFTPRLDVTSSRFFFIAAGLPPNTTLFNVDELKVTQFAASAATACETVTVSSESVWLKNPLQPCLDVEIGLCSPMVEDCDEDARVSYVGTRGDAYSPNTVLLGPANRQYLIPLSRTRRAPAATLQLLAHDCQARNAVLATNEPGTPLLFQAPADYCIPDRYISVDVLEEVKISIDQREDFRLMNLPYATVQRPEGPADGPCGTRIQDLCDIYTSWAALAAAGFTWTDLMLGEASPNGPGQPPLPEDARTWLDVETEFANWLAVEGGGTRDWGELRDGL